MAIIASSSAAAIGAGAAAALALLLLLILIFRFRRPTHSSDKPASASASASDSDPSAGAEAEVVDEAISRARARQFSMEEMEHATMDFNPTNVIGTGGFGVAYKGLLRDGTAVAIKRRHAAVPKQQFPHQVAYLSSIQHRNLVKLVGYCQERGTQMLVFEYLPNTTISSHLYGNDSSTKLEFKQRLSIAIGAAKGLCYLHELQPPLVHSNFKTSNVLVDENFIAKVADAGIHQLLEDDEAAGSCSSSPSFNAFKDPEFEALAPFQDRSDVYSFGVFLLELITGEEASKDSIYQWVQEHLDLDDAIDQRLIGSFTEEGMRDLMKLMMRCTRFPGRERPRMESVVAELERILEHEVTRTTDMGDGTATVTLGSQLFTN